MNDSATTVDNPTDNPPAVTSSGLKIATVCAILVVVRIYLYWVGKQTFSPESFSWTATLSTMFAAIIVALVAALLTRKWFGKLISLLSAIVFGAIAAAHLASPFGAFFGGIVGFFVVFDLPRQCFWIAMRWFARVGLWAFVAGVFSGCLFLNFVRVQNRSVQVAVILGALSLCMLIGIALRAKTQRASGSKLKKVCITACSLLAAFLSLVCGWVCGVEVVNQYTYHQLNKAGGAGFAFNGPSRWLTYGITACDHARMSGRASDTTMQILRRTPDLEGLSVRTASITDTGFQEIANSKRLKWIIIEKANLTDDAFSALSRLQLVQSLGLAGLPIGDSAIKNMGRKPFLMYLQLDNTNVSDRGMKWIGQFPRLWTLGLARTAITDKGLAELTAPSIQSVDVSYTQIRGSGLAHLAKLKSLRTLNLSSTQVAPEYIELLVACPSLVTLILEELPIDEQAVMSLRKMPALKHLGIAGTNISDDLAKQLPKLQSLTIDCLNLSPSTILLFMQSQTSLELSLQNQLLTPEWIERARQFGIEITCWNCTVDLAALESLERHENNIRLHFMNLRISDEHYERLRFLLGVTVSSRDESWQQKGDSSSGS